MLTVDTPSGVYSKISARYGVSHVETPMDTGLRNPACQGKRGETPHYAVTVMRAQEHDKPDRLLSLILEQGVGASYVETLKAKFSTRLEAVF